MQVWKIFTDGYHQTNIQMNDDDLAITYFFTFATVSNIGMRTNFMNPICAVGFVTLSLSINGATGRPSIFSLSDCKKYYKNKYYLFFSSCYSSLLISKEDVGCHLKWFCSFKSLILKTCTIKKSAVLDKNQTIYCVPDWSTLPGDNRPKAPKLPLVGLHWKCRNILSAPSSTILYEKVFQTFVGNWMNKHETFTIFF